MSYTFARIHPGGFRRKFTPRAFGENLYEQLKGAIAGIVMQEKFGEGLINGHRLTWAPCGHVEGLVSCAHAGCALAQHPRPAKVVGGGEHGGKPGGFTSQKWRWFAGNV